MDSKRGGHLAVVRDRHHLFAQRCEVQKEQQACIAEHGHEGNHYQLIGGVGDIEKIHSP